MCRQTKTLFLFTIALFAVFFSFLLHSFKHWMFEGRIYYLWELPEWVLERVCEWLLLFYWHFIHFVFYCVDSFFPIQVRYSEGNATGNWVWKDCRSICLIFLILYRNMYSVESWFQMNTLSPKCLAWYASLNIVLVLLWYCCFFILHHRMVFRVQLLKLKH